MNKSTNDFTLPAGEVTIAGETHKIDFHVFVEMDGNNEKLISAFKAGKSEALASLKAEITKAIDKCKEIRSLPVSCSPVNAAQLHDLEWFLSLIEEQEGK